MVAGLHHCGGWLTETDYALLSLLSSTVDVLYFVIGSIFGVDFHENLPYFDVGNVLERILRLLISCADLQLHDLFHDLPHI